ncbi:Hypothetical predicted protein [Cloeon dipterum]|uniref:RRM domain-containing protein n=1 Tax=Cloeon dipterum TaxID=197152 RepID=A0A8S1CZ10_9INSE|nr:Hypothetical predicted protein [Cloeon dipterum]
MNESRLFIGNLPPGVSEKELKSKLKKYGNLTDVTVKERLDHNGKITATFAHCTLSSDRDIMKCLDDLMSEGAWNGHNLKAEVAKKTFEQRRQESAPVAVIKEKTSPAKPSCPEVTKVKAAKTSKLPPKKDDESSDSEDEVYWSKMGDKKADNAVEFVSQEAPKRRRREEEAPTKLYKAQSTSAQSDLLKRLEKFSNVWGDSEGHSSPSFSSSINSAHRIYTPQTNGNEKAEAVEKKIKRKSENGDAPKVKRKSIKEEVGDPQEKTTKVASKQEKKIRSEEQRLQSLDERANFFKQQQEAVKKALSDKNAKNKKIVFDDDNEEPAAVANAGAMKLFDDESGDEGGDADRFKIKKQFEGKKGEKLLEMQSTFGMDERFKLDKRFAEEDVEGGSDSEHEDPEIKNQLAILEEVVGPLKKKSKLAENMPNFVRYDPSKSDHDKKYKRNTEETKKEEEEKPEQALPEVSSERFYEVKSDLLSLLQSSEDFNLRDVIGGGNEGAAPTNGGTVEPKAKIEKKAAKSLPEKMECDEDLKKAVDSIPTTSWSLSTETFFFLPDDPRFKEGLEFINNAKVLDSNDYKLKRQELYATIKNKLKNVRRKKTTFEKKLGGKPKNFKYSNGRNSNARRQIKK